MKKILLLAAVATMLASCAPQPYQTWQGGKSSTPHGKNVPCDAYLPRRQ